MSVAFSSAKFISDTPGEKLERYKQDLIFFQKLRLNLKRRYAEEIDFREHEATVQKLLVSHAASTEALQVAPLVNIFDKEEFQAEIDRIESLAARAETIAYRTKKAIAEKMDEDPFFYRGSSKTLDDALEAWRAGRLPDAEFLKQVTEVMNKVRDRSDHDLPPELQSHEAAKAFYGAVNDLFGKLKAQPPNARKIAIEAALEIDRIIQDCKVVDWASNLDVQNEMRNRIDDYLYELKNKRGIELSFDEMDFIIESSINIAKTRYAQ
jgi:type I restriction enzyme R subunit